MKKHTTLIRVVIITSAIFVAGVLRADRFHIGIGVTPHGNSLSIGYGYKADHPIPGRSRVRHAPTPLPRRVVCHRPAGHYETRIERVWVDGYWRRVAGRRGRITSVWTPGYWTEQTVRVWVDR